MSRRDRALARQVPVTVAEIAETYLIDLASAIRSNSNERLFTYYARDEPVPYHNHSRIGRPEENLATIALFPTPKKQLPVEQ